MRRCAGRARAATTPRSSPPPGCPRPSGTRGPPRPARSERRRRRTRPCCARGCPRCSSGPCWRRRQSRGGSTRRSTRRASVACERRGGHRGDRRPALRAVVATGNRRIPREGLVLVPLHRAAEGDIGRETQPEGGAPEVGDHADEGRGDHIEQRGAAGARRHVVRVPVGVASIRACSASESPLAGRSYSSE